jgi:hypothetical protein
MSCGGTTRRVVSANEHPQPVPAEPRRSRLKRVGTAAGVAVALVGGISAALMLTTADTRDATGPPPLPTVATTGDTGPPYPVGTTPGSNPSEVDEALAALEPANIAFNTPTELHVDEQEAVQLLVSREQAIEELQAQIDAVGDKEGAQITVSDVMIATLNGLAFDIERTSDERQPVATTGVTMWSWSVEPRDPGTRSLHLTLSALIDVDGKEETYTVKTFDRTWTVVVPWPDRVKGFAGDNWQWLWTAILLPLAAFVWRRLRVRQRGERPVAHG